MRWPRSTSHALTSVHHLTWRDHSSSDCQLRVQHCVWVCGGMCEVLWISCRGLMLLRIHMVLNVVPSNLHVAQRSRSEYIGNECRWVARGLGRLFLRFHIVVCVCLCARYGEHSYIFIIKLRHNNYVAYARYVIIIYRRVRALRYSFTGLYCVYRIRVPGPLPVPVPVRYRYRTGTGPVRR